jgi:hypothetical protein
MFPLHRFTSLTTFTKHFLLSKQPYQLLSIDYKGNYFDMFFRTFQLDLKVPPDSSLKTFTPLKSLRLSDMTLKLKGSTSLYSFLSSAVDLHLSNVALHCVKDDPLEDTPASQILTRRCTFD